MKASYVSAIRDVSSGDKINAFSLTEPNFGSESGAIQTTAVLDGDYYIINGTQIFVTNGDILITGEQAK